MFYLLSLTAKGDNRFNDQMPNTLTDAFQKKIHDFNIKTQNVYKPLIENRSPPLTKFLSTS